MGTVPRADHFFAYERTFRQRPATMGAGIVDRVVVRAYPEDGEAPPAGVHKLPAFHVFEVRHGSNLYNLTHENLLPDSSLHLAALARQSRQDTMQGATGGDQSRSELDDWL
jgi:hypothetical protein